MRGPTLNVRQTAKRLGVHENTVRNWTDAGRLTDVSPEPLRGRRFDAGQVDALAASLRRERFLRRRPDVLACPVCRVPAETQPADSDRETAYICDTDDCPVSSFAIRWRTAQEELADALATRTATAGER